MIDLTRPGSIKAVSVEDGVRNPRLQGLLRYWNELRGDRPMPARDEIDPIDIPSLLPIILIADVAADGPKIRLMGTDATSAYGQETRGAPVSAFNLGEFTPLWLEAFARVVNAGTPALASGPYHGGLEVRSVETILMPLSDDGTAITHILGGLLIRPAPCATPAEAIAPSQLMPSARVG